MVPVPTTPNAHRYRTLPTNDGFILDGGPDRPHVRVSLRPTCWLVEPLEQPEEGISRRFGLFEIRPLIDSLAHFSMCHWRPRPSPAPAWRLHDWALRQARRSIAWVVGQERRRLMPGINPAVRDVQRALFAACCSAGQLALLEPFNHPADHFLLEDIRRYRAAAIAVRYIGDDLLEYYSEREEPDEIDCGHYSGPTIVQRICRRLRDWRGLFSNTGRSYSALNLTLDSLPGNLSPRLVCGLSRVHLQRPVLDRLELTMLLLSLEGHEQRQERLLQAAQRPDILRALPRVARAPHRPLSPRRTDDLRTFVRFLCDSPEPHTGNIVGLAERSIRYHRDLARQQADQAMIEAGDGALVALPPVPLPSISGLTFLSTVDAIRREGMLMGHCIANYAPYALEGGCFLFHFAKGDDLDSIAQHFPKEEQALLLEFWHIYDAVVRHFLPKATSRVYCFDGGVRGGVRYHVLVRRQG